MTNEEFMKIKTYKKGNAVTHFDISQTMIDKAKELAAKAGVLVCRLKHRDC